MLIAHTAKKLGRSKAQLPNDADSTLEYCQRFGLGERQRETQITLCQRTALLSMGE
jgi:hypothetical protein